MSYSIRFRHTQGDIGPFNFSQSATVGDIKQQLWERWPSDGPLLKERPSNAAELRLILSGKFLSDSESLRSLQSSLGEPRDDLLVTMHVIVRPASFAKTTAAPVEKEKSKTCGCTIS